MAISLFTLAAAFTLCAEGPRINCVVDGDTFWANGEKIRLADINAPETTQAGCAEERALGQRAKLRLLALLNAGPFTLEIAGRAADRYGRALRVARRRGRSLGDVLVSEGLAEPWRGRRNDWCTMLTTR
ncbi:MAG: thermonuclease family protein [Sphingomonadaceae bacterium]|nr:thermonuclease family protein [Sphingomonadaceae bacterium]